MIITKKLIALCITLALFAALFSITAFAAIGDPTLVSIIGVNMKVGDYLPSGNSPDASQLTTTKPSGGYAYMKDATTLVLHNYSYDGTGYDSMFGYQGIAVAEFDSTVTIVIEGTNSIKCNGTNGQTILVANDCNLILTGTEDESGSLDVWGSKRGIYGSGDVTITNCDVTAWGNESAIYAPASLSMIDSTVDASSSSSSAIVAYSDDIEIANTTLAVKSEQMSAITANNGSIAIKNGSDVEVDGNNNGMYAKSDITISDSTVNVKGNKAGAASYHAIYAMGGLSIADSEIVAENLGTSSAVDCATFSVDGYTRDYTMKSGDAAASAAVVSELTDDSYFAIELVPIPETTTAQAAPAQTTKPAEEKEVIAETADNNSVLLWSALVGVSFIAAGKAVATKKEND